MRSYDDYQYLILYFVRNEIKPECLCYSYNTHMDHDYSIINVCCVREDKMLV